MKLIIPNNIFATLFVLSLEEEKRPDIVVKESSLITSELNNDYDIGLIPSFDLINNRDLFVSSKIGIGFEGLLSNSFVYYSKSKDEIEKVLLRGDISTNEAILTKLVFKERYNIVPEISLDSSNSLNDDSNYLVVGNENLNSRTYQKGMSFGEQISELIDFPYLNFVFASKSKKTIEEFNKKFENINKSVKSGLSKNLKMIGLDSDVNEFIEEEIDSIYYDLVENEIEGLKQLFQFVYFHKIIDDLFEIKFVK